MVRAILAGAAALLVGGCAVSQSTEQVVLDYNRSFAKTRNEMLLLNVLRAAAREPMQFSTMGQVQGQIGNGGQITIPLTNVIAGGRDAISPSLLFTDAVNPQVSIIPLASKEFAEGILRPIRTDIVQLFLHNGWDAEFLLPLVVGGIVCPDGRLLHNSGEYAGGESSRASYDAFKRFFERAAKTITLSSGHSGPPARHSFVLTDKEAMTALKEGVGAGYSVVEVKDAGEARKTVTVETAKSAAIGGVDVGGLCDELAPGTRSAAPPPDYSGLIGAVDIRPAVRAPGSPPQPKPGKLVFRSVASIIHYLGESHRVRFRHDSVDRRGLTYVNAFGTEQILFKADWGLSAAPKAVSVRFHGDTFHVPEIDLRAGEGIDRTLKTLSFLDQLIALQTNESAIRGATSVIAVSQ
jgi:hypothetical protein